MLDATAADTVTDAVEAAWGPVSVLVANAGQGLSAPIARYPDEMWDRQLELNLTAPFRCVRRVSKTDGGGGAVSCWMWDSATRA